MYEQGPGSNYPRSYQSVNGVLILVLGILSIVMCGCLAGIPAWLMGNNALASINAGTGDPNEKQLANVGRILGIVGTCLSLCGTIVWIAMVALGMAGAMMPGAR